MEVLSIWGEFVFNFTSTPMVIWRPGHYFVSFDNVEARWIELRGPLGIRRVVYPLHYRCSFLAFCMQYGKFSIEKMCAPINNIRAQLHFQSKNNDDAQSAESGSPSQIRFVYSKTCVKWPLSNRPKIGFQDQLSLNAGQKYCRMLQGEHSALLLIFIKLPFVLSIFERPFYTGFTVFIDLPK